MTICSLHHTCASRARTGLAVLVGAILAASALGWWAYAPVDAEVVAPLQTLILMHRGDLPAPAQP